MPTRFYLPQTGTAPTGSFVPPTGTGAGQWNNTGSAVVRPMPRTKSNTALTSAAVTRTVTTAANPFDRLHRVYVSDPLPFGQTISGSFSLVIKAFESATGYDSFIQCGIRVVSGDGSVLRGLLYDGSAATTVSTTAGAENQEFSTTPVQSRIKNAIPLSRSVVAQAGDRIVFTIGNRQVSTTTTSTQSVTYQWGDPTATADAPLTAGSTTAGTPWFELSQDVFTAPDTTAPTVPTNLQATPAAGQVALTWTASTDAVGVADYRVYRGGVLLGTATGTSYVDGTVAQSTGYSYTVTARDAAGNESDPSTAAPATTGTWSFGPVVLHSSTPALAHSAANPVVSPAFTPPAGALLVALSAFDTANQRTATVDTVTGDTSAWTEVIDGANVGVFGNGVVSIDRATVTTSVSTTVRTTWSASNPMDLVVAVIEGGEVLASGALLASTTQTVTIPRTRPGTRALFVYSNFGNTTKPAFPADWTEIGWNAVSYGSGAWITPELSAGDNVFSVPATSANAGLAWVEVGGPVTSGGGGTAHESSATSTAGATDAAERTLTANRTAVDAAGATDTHSRTLEANRTAVSSAGASDAHSWSMGAERTASSAAGASDSASWTMASGRSAVSAAGASDTASWTAEVVRPVADTAGATDSVSTSLDAQRTASSSAGATDSAAWTMDVARGAVSAAGATDVASASLTAVRSPVDVAGATDSVTTSLEANRGAVSSAGATDSVTVAIDYVRHATSGAGATDTATAETSRPIDRAASSAAGATDSASTVLDAQRSPVSTAGAVDSVTVAIDYVRMAVSGAGATDTASASLAAVRSASSGAGAVDAAGTTQDYTRTATSTAGVTDSASWTANVVRTASSTADARDEVTVQAAGQTTATATSAAGATDSVAVVRDVVRYASSGAGATDAVSAVRDVHRTASSAAGAVDAASTSAAAGQERAAVSTAGATDAATVQIDAVRGAVSTAGATDSVTWEMARTIVRYATSGAGATDTVDAVRDVHRAASSTAGAVDATGTARDVTATAVSAAGVTDSHSWTISTFRGAYVIEYGEVRTASTGRAGRVRRPETADVEVRRSRTEGELRHGHTKEEE